MTLGELFTALGYATGIAVFIWAARRKRLGSDGIWTLAAWGFVAALMGAKITQFVAEGWPGHGPWWAILDPETGGRALLGGIATGWIAVEVAKRKLGIRRSTGDLFALALPAGEAVGRIGCFFNGCCYGSECNLPWAVYQHGAWRHPAQLYSSIVALSIFGTLLLLDRHGLREGDLFKVYLVLFGSSRFLLEFVRWRESLVLGLSPMQWFCLDLVLMGSVGLILGKRRLVGEVS